MRKITAHRLAGRVRSILLRVSYKAPHALFRVTRTDDCVFLQHRQIVKCVNSGKKDYQGGRKFYISPHMTDDEILRTAFLAVKIFEEHEINENFLVDGKRFLNPHPEGPRPSGPIETREACTCGSRSTGYHSRNCARVMAGAGR